MIEVKKLNDISKKSCEIEIFLGWCGEEECSAAKNHWNKICMIENCWRTQIQVSSHRHIPTTKQDPKSRPIPKIRSK
jgi:hypothetical protein